MGTAPKEKTERNQQLIADYESGMGTVKLVSKYRITPQRIYQIVKSFRGDGLRKSLELPQS